MTVARITTAELAQKPNSSSCLAMLLFSLADNDYLIEFPVSMLSSAVLKLLLCPSPSSTMEIAQKGMNQLTFLQV
jgi:hypothetical protein